VIDARSRSFEQVISKARSKGLLQSILVELTYRCNLDCFFCYNDLGLRGVPVPTERYLELYAELLEEG
jgi:MoaA/NifB/PqqE/SkfB family radical SAM enzyme